MEFMQDFPDDASCLEWLWQTRYSPNGAEAKCPKCEQTREFARYQTGQQRQSWTCKGCGYHLHPTAGTIFHKSSTSLHLWFYAMYLMTSTRCGISAKQLEREIGVTYKTAWRMMHLIRNKLMTQEDDPIDGSKPVEMDETYVGGVRRLAAGRPHPDDPKKTAVFGIVERKGKVFATTVPSVQGSTLLTHVVKQVPKGTKVYSDEMRSYQGLGAAGYDHETILHKDRVYVRGNVHTNTIEGFWSLTKRGIHGVFHSVSKKHLQGYLNEYAWRYNQRDSGRAQFSTILLRATVRG